MPAESFLFSIAATVLIKIGSLLGEQLCSSFGLKGDLENLDRTLSAIKAVLLDAEEHQHQNYELKVWLGNLRDALCDAEDVLDKFECEALRRRLAVVRRGTAETKFLSCFYNPLSFRFRVVNKIRNISKRLDDIEAHRPMFSLHDRLALRRVFSRQRTMTHSFVCPSDVVGRDDDKENIINLLMQSSSSTAERISVIPVVGIGGSGKTTLAKMVYNDPRVLSHFNLKMWVCVSEDFDVQRLMKEIIVSATGENFWLIPSNMINFPLTRDHHHHQRMIVDDPVLSTDQLQSRLRATLRGRRFLLVLDDVWNDSQVEWNGLKELLMGGADGSKILVTTRSSQAANIMGGAATPTYNLGRLSHHCCLLLLVRWAFRTENVHQYPHLVDIMNDIIRKCGGVPLAVRTLGTLLYQKTNPRDWVFVRNNELWRLEQGQNDILPALKLSYNHLPSHLQQCFAFCSIFPKGYLFHSKYLVYYWMAHGLLATANDNNNNEELEDVGSRYLNELVSRCFFQDVEDHGLYYTFKMHDLMHDLTTAVAWRQCSRVSFGTLNVDVKVPHLSVIESNFDGRKVPKLLNSTRHIRTIFFPGKQHNFVSKSFLKKCILNFKYIRMLHLNNLLFKALPDSVGSLKHLRFLDLSWNLNLEKLPKSICELQSLQTLRLVGCTQLQKLPDDIGNLISLRLLEITIQGPLLPEIKRGSWSSLRHLCFHHCIRIQTLFEGMQYFTNLRSLSVQNCSSLTDLPRKLELLTKLEELQIVSCPALLYFPENMNSLRDLKELKIKDSRTLSEHCRLDWRLAHIPIVQLD